MTSAPDGAQSGTAPENVVVLVAPPEAVSLLRIVLAGLPPEFPAAFVILLYAGTGHERPVAPNLNTKSGFLVMPGEDGTPLRTGRATIVRPEQSLGIGRDGILRVAPDAEGFLVSVAARYGRNAVAVALTALDGVEAKGFRRIREEGGHTIALDEADFLWTHPAGPRVVPNEADELLPARDIGRRLLTMLTESPVALSA